MKDTILTNLHKILITALLGIIGFLIVSKISDVNYNLIRLNKEVVDLQIEVAKINANMLTEDRVREICQYEILKEHEKLNK